MSIISISRNPGISGRANVQAKGYLKEAKKCDGRDCDTPSFILRRAVCAVALFC